jgi:hypothetical protein
VPSSPQASLQRHLEVVQEAQRQAERRQAAAERAAAAAAAAAAEASAAAALARASERVVEDRRAARAALSLTPQAPVSIETSGPPPPPATPHVATEVRGTAWLGDWASLALAERHDDHGEAAQWLCWVGRGTKDAYPSVTMPCITHPPWLDRRRTTTHTIAFIVCATGATRGASRGTCPSTGCGRGCSDPGLPRAVAPKVRRGQSALLCVPASALDRGSKPAP